MIEEKEGKIHLKPEKCPKCEKIMTGLFYKFYKAPGFMISEELASITFYDIWFQCISCRPLQTVHVPEEEVDKINQYPLDDIIFPGQTKNSKATITKIGDR